MTERSRWTKRRNEKKSAESMTDEHLLSLLPDFVQADGDSNNIQTSRFRLPDSDNEGMDVAPYTEGRRGRQKLGPDRTDADCIDPAVIHFYYKNN